MKSIRSTDIYTTKQTDVIFPLVTVIVPCRNESKFIESLINSLLEQDYPKEKVEIIIADGMSDDGTREILQSFSSRYPRIKIVDNPEKIVSTGLNAAILHAKGNIIVRMDCHTKYASNYITECVNVLKVSDADNVGGPWIAVGISYLQKAIAAAFQSPFSCGGAGSHRTTFEGEVDTVYLGCWRKDTLLKLGLFDESLVRNQDDELNYRIIRSGGKIWQSLNIKSWYYPRPSLKALFKQYYQYGYWKVRVIRKHGRPASFRHIVPAAFVFAALTSFITSIFSPAMRISLIAVLAPYAVFNFGASVITAKKTSWSYLPVLPLVFGAFHFGYGLGFLHGLVAQWLGLARCTRTVTDLSR